MRCRRWFWWGRGHLWEPLSVGARPAPHPSRSSTATNATKVPDARKTTLAASGSSRWLPSDSEPLSGAPTLGC
jgi:hypothetical protein